MVSSALWISGSKVYCLDGAQVQELGGLGFVELRWKYTADLRGAAANQRGLSALVSVGFDWAFPGQMEMASFRVIIPAAGTC